MEKNKVSRYQITSDQIVSYHGMISRTHHTKLLSPHALSPLSSSIVTSLTHNNNNNRPNSNHGKQHQYSQGTAAAGTPDVPPLSPRPGRRTGLIDRRPQSPPSRNVATAVDDSYPEPDTDAIVGRPGLCHPEDSVGACCLDDSVAAVGELDDDVLLSENQIGNGSGVYAGADHNDDDDRVGSGSGCCNSNSSASCTAELFPDHSGGSAGGSAGDGDTRRSFRSKRRRGSSEGAGPAMGATADDRSRQGKARRREEDARGGDGAGGGGAGGDETEPGEAMGWTGRLGEGRAGEGAAEGGAGGGSASLFSMVMSGSSSSAAAANSKFSSGDDGSRSAWSGAKRGITGSAAAAVTSVASDKGTSASSAARFSSSRAEGGTVSSAHSTLSELLSRRASASKTSNRARLAPPLLSRGEEGGVVDRERTGLMNAPAVADSSALQQQQQQQQAECREELTMDAPSIIGTPSGGRRGGGVPRGEDWLAMELDKLSDFRVAETRMGFPVGGGGTEAGRKVGRLDEVGVGGGYCGISYVCWR